MRRWWLSLFVLASAALSTGVLAAGAAVRGADEIVGAKRCRDCHKSAFEAWSKSPHARSHVALTGPRATDPRCTQCHGLSGSDKTAVQCEVCHGQGQYYSQRYVMKDRELARLVGLESIDRKVLCQKCHTASAPTIQPFDLDRKWELMAHGQDKRTPEVQ